MFNKPINRWWTVVAGVLGCAGGAGMIATYALGVFIKPISAEFGWDRSFTTAGISCFYIVSGIGSVVFGSIVSRWSLRSWTMVFVALFSASVILIAFLPKSVIVFCLVFALMGFFGAAASAMPYAVAVAAQFDRNRGVALAIVVCGYGLGALLLPGYANWLLERFGWRAGYVGIGVFAGAIALVGLTFFFRTPRHEPSSATAKGPSLRELYTSGGTFWLVAAAFFCVSVALIGLITNLAAILTDRGTSTAQAASMLSLLGAASWVSRIGVGILLDRVHVRYIAACVFLTAALGVAVFALGLQGPWIYVAIICVGLGIGAETDLLTYTMSRYFPAAALGRALGAVWIFWAWGNATGVFLGSLSFDLTGSYDWAMIAFALLAIVSSVTALRLGPYTFPPRGVSIGVAHSARDAEQVMRMTPTHSPMDS